LKTIPDDPFVQAEIVAVNPFGWRHAVGYGALLLQLSEEMPVILTQETASTMKYLWSPWRMSYIMDHERGNDCVFCVALNGDDDAENLVLHRGHQAFVMLNRYPYTSGHLMVVPDEHTPDLAALSPQTRSELMELIVSAETVIDITYRPEGFNIGANLGAAAGAGIAGHLHFHIVPRWAGDTNFMSTLANTRVLPEELTETYRRLSEAWKKTQ
jgi:ATP adenylyltransferase